MKGLENQMIAIKQSVAERFELIPLQHRAQHLFARCFTFSGPTKNARNYINVKLRFGEIIDCYV